LGGEARERATVATGVPEGEGSASQSDCAGRQPAVVYAEPVPLLLPFRPEPLQGTEGLLPEAEIRPFLDWYEFLVLRLQQGVNTEECFRLWRAVVTFQQRGLQLNQWLQDDVDALCGAYESGTALLGERFAAASYLQQRALVLPLTVSAVRVRRFLHAEVWEQIRLQIGIYLEEVRQACTTRFPASLEEATRLVVSEFARASKLAEL